LILKVVKLPN